MYWVEIYLEGFRELTDNAVDLVTSPSGKAVLSSAIVLATAGGIARNFPQCKTGWDKTILQNIRR